MYIIIINHYKLLLIVRDRSSYFNVAKIELEILLVMYYIYLFRINILDLIHYIYCDN